MLVLVWLVAGGVVVASTAPNQPGVRITHDLAYLGGARTEKADLYVPAGVETKGLRPAILVIHGGGWVGGDKAAEREVNICTTLALHGYVAMSINYHLGTKGQVAASWPQNIRDCKTAVRWLRTNASAWGIDPARIGVLGSSAGGHLASMLGVTGEGAPFDEPAGAVTPARVSAVVALYAPIQLGLGPLDEAADRRTSPLSYLDSRRAIPPFLLIHGTADRDVSVERSRAFAAALAAAGVEHRLVLVEGATHSFALQPAPMDLRPVVLGFLATWMRAEPTD